MSDLLNNVVNDPEFLGRQANHSRSVLIVFLLHYQQNSGYSRVIVQSGDHEQDEAIHIMHMSLVLQIFLVCHIDMGGTFDIAHTV